MSVKNSLTAKAAIERYMNHEPEECTYGSCGALCQEAVRAKGTDPPGARTLPSGNLDTVLLNAEPIPPEQTSDVRCAMCGAPMQGFSQLCQHCYDDPDDWLGFVSRKHALVSEQTRVLEFVCEGKNVFFTGAAGTGKSLVLHAIKGFLRGTGVGVTTIAPTGIASLNIGGRTIHSFAGWDQNIEREPLKPSCDDRARMKLTYRRFEATDVLVIDEISMISSNNVTRLSQMMQSAAASREDGRQEEPFGGVQVILLSASSGSTLR